MDAFLYSIFSGTPGVEDLALDKDFLKTGRSIDRLDLCRRGGPLFAFCRCSHFCLAISPPCFQHIFLIFFVVACPELCNSATQDAVVAGEAETEFRQALLELDDLRKARLQTSL